MIQNFKVNYSFPVHFTENLFKEENLLLRRVIEEGGNAPAKILLILDKNLLQVNKDLIKQIEQYLKLHKDVLTYSGLVVLEGGESVKNDFGNVEMILNAINQYGICRHSYT